jgi:hypothetical protein
MKELISDDNKWIISMNSFIFFIFLTRPLVVKGLNSLTSFVGLRICNSSGLMNNYGVIIQGTLMIFLSRVSIERY